MAMNFWQNFPVRMLMCCCWILICQVKPDGKLYIKLVMIILILKLLSSAFPQNKIMPNSFTRPVPLVIWPRTVPRNSSLRLFEKLRAEEYISARSSLKKWSMVLKMIWTRLFMKTCLPGNCKSFAWLGREKLWLKLPMNLIWELERWELIGAGFSQKPPWKIMRKSPTMLSRTNLSSKYSPHVAISFLFFFVEFQIIKIQPACVFCQVFFLPLG